MCFGETDHAFELASCGSYAPFGGGRVFAHFAKGDVGFDEFGAGGFSYGGVDFGAGVGDVGGDGFEGLSRMLILQNLMVGGMDEPGYLVQRSLVHLPNTNRLKTERVAYPKLRQLYPVPGIISRNER